LSLLPVCACPSCPTRPDTPTGSGCEVYPSLLTDTQWALVEALLPPPRNRTSWGGRPEKHPRRQILDAVFYLVRAGVAWRYLPKGFPPWDTVYGFFARWRADGTWLRIHDALRDRVRVAAGREPNPTAAIIDSQSVRRNGRQGQPGLRRGQEGQRPQTTHRGGRLRAPRRTGQPSPQLDEQLLTPGQPGRARLQPRRIPRRQPPLINVHRPDRADREPAPIPDHPQPVDGRNRLCCAGYGQASPVPGAGGFPTCTPPSTVPAATPPRSATMCTSRPAATP
jgi:transposase